MSPTSQLAGRPTPTSFWGRWLALASILLVLFGSTAQAAHIHGDWMPHTHTELSSQRSDLPTGNEAGCSLCVAMHSAAAVAESRWIAPATAIERCVQTSDLAVASLPWHFSLFSRPPPAANL